MYQYMILATPSIEYVYMLTNIGPLSGKNQSSLCVLLCKTFRCFRKTFEKPPT